MLELSPLMAGSRREERHSNEPPNASWKNTLIVFGVVALIGLIGVTQVPINEMTSSVHSAAAPKEAVLAPVVSSDGTQCGPTAANGRNPSYTYVEGRVIACDGPFTGGLFSASAASLCDAANGWRVCKGASDAAAQGLTKTMCAATPNKKFYATQQRGDGGHRCNNVGYNDVFGCGNGLGMTSSVAADCNPLLKTAGNLFGAYNGKQWTCPGCVASKGLNELREVSHQLNGDLIYDGGVMCCKSQTTCPSGQYLSGGTCHTCPAGHACGKNVKAMCPAGWWQASTGKSTCVKASCGHFVPAPGATSQNKCRAGTYSGVGAKQCTVTPKGYYSGEGACAPSKCPEGQFQDCEGQSSCQKGPCGHFVSGTGKQVYTPCPAGTYQPQSGQKSCLTTPAGSYSGVGHCKPRACIPGYWQDKSGQSKCKPADCGKHQPNPGSNNQVSCGKGFYQPQPGQPACLAIPAGYISVQNGCAIQCCPAGTYRDSNFKCVPAPCGSYVANKCSSKAIQCPTGTFTSGTGATSCTKSPPGSIPNSNHCGTKKCPKGTYQPTLGGSKCLDTPCGKYTSSDGSANPSLCAPGSFQDKTRQTGCKPCAAGSANPSPGKCSCPLCIPGTYQPGSGKTSCINSPCGHFVKNPGSTKFDPCPPGTYQPKTKQTGCVNAAPGQFAVGGKCAPGVCPPGTYTPSPAQTKCAEAKCGHFVDKPGQSGQTPCVAGQYQPLPGQTKCLAAPTGSYTNGGGKCQETLCKPGYYQSQTGQKSCTPAKCGHYVVITGSASQSPCGPGRYQPLPAQTSCKNADKGYFVSGAGSCKQHRCPEGSYTDCNGQSQCIKAPCGHFVQGTGKTVLSTCPAGTYQDTPGQGGCKTSPAGTSSGAGFCYAAACDPGTYQPAKGQSSCKFADCGYFVDGEGRKSQSECQSRTYQPKIGQVGCLYASQALYPGTCELGTGTGGLFYAGPTKLSWPDARAWCQGNGDDLAIIRSASQNAAAIAACGKVPGNCYLGGTDAAKEGTWLWIDGSSFAGNYQNWSPGEPNNGGKGSPENCLLTWSQGRWNDGHCHVKEYPLCERRAHRVCVNPNNGYAKFHVRRGGKLKSLKVTRVSGKFEYCHGTVPLSSWCWGYYGIGYMTKTPKHGYDLFFTRADPTKVLFPIVGNTAGFTPNEPHRFPGRPFYLLNGGDPQTKTPITLTNNNPLTVAKGEEVRVYVGEVLYNHHPTDNHGVVCYDVRVTIQ